MEYAKCWHSGEQPDQCMMVRCCAVYGRKPSKNQKDHREQLLANSKSVETMAGCRMVRHCLPLKVAAQVPWHTM